MFYDSIMKVKLSSFNNFESSAPRVLTSRKKGASPYSYPESNQAKSKNGVHLQLNNNEENYKGINRPTESVSFSGSAVSEEDNETAKKKKNIIIAAAGTAITIGTGALLIASKMKKNTGGGDIFTKLASSKRFNHLVNFAEENEAQIKAVLALGMAGMLKPICVLAMPGAEKEDKQFTATKNAISAFMGFLLSCAILNPISAGVNEFLKHPEEYLGKDNDLVNRFAEDKKEVFKTQTFKERWFSTYKMNESGAFKTTYKNALGLFVAPAKAALTIALMPLVLKFLFGDRAKKENKTPQPMYMDILNNPNMIANSKIDKVFDNFIKRTVTK